VETQLRSEIPGYQAAAGHQRLLVQDVPTRLVDRESVLLRFFLGTVRSYVWAVTSDRTTVDALPGRTELEHRIRQYREACSTADDSAGGSRDDERQQSRSLGTLLLGPVAWALDRPRVLILADGMLQLLPFAALSDPRVPAPAAPVPLIVDHEVVHLPTASLLVARRGKWPRPADWSGSVVVFGDPVFEPSDPRIDPGPGRPIVSRSDGDECPRPAFSGAAVHRLPSSADEAHGIGALAPGARVLTGFDANRTALADTGLSKYKIVHLATHGIIDDRHPERSGIVLSLFDRSGRPQDGYLQLRDIRNLHLPAELVVLSACATAPSGDVPELGLSGFVRSFMSAGSRRVAATLWKADDEATMALIGSFYGGLFERGLTPPAALRAAQVELLTSGRWTRPFYWAAFVLQGEWT
jgi:CHAT domain-containing protein